MSAQRSVREILDELHLALEATPAVDDNEREALVSAAAEIREHLENSDEGTLGERIQERLRAFESSHPKLTELAGRVADALAEAGL